MGKKEKATKKDAGSDSEHEEQTINVNNIAPIAHPLAGKKLQKRLLKVVKKGAFYSRQSMSDRVASKSKHIKRGVKEVVKSLRKGEKG